MLAYYSYSINVSSPKTFSLDPLMSKVLQEAKPTSLYCYSIFGQKFPCIYIAKYAQNVAYIAIHSLIAILKESSYRMHSIRPLLQRFRSAHHSTFLQYL